MAEKIRIDIALHQRGLAPSREKARAMIMAGEVTVNGQLIDKPGARIDADAELVTKAKPRFVSRGGDKLEGALIDFNYPVTDKRCADVGASTGGFTDCLLQHGASKVYAIDVGYGQLDYNLRTNPRVVSMERTNARYVEHLDHPIDLTVIDASFISLKLLLPVIKRWLTENGDVIALIKPQFEAGRKDVGKGGVVRDHQIHARVLTETLLFAQEIGFGIQGLTRSRLKGPAGNIEFLVWLRLATDNAASIESFVQQAMNDSPFS